MGTWYSRVLAPSPPTAASRRPLTAEQQQLLHTLITIIHEEFDDARPFRFDYATVAGRHARFQVAPSHRFPDGTTAAIIYAYDPIVEGLITHGHAASSVEAATHALEKLAFCWVRDGYVTSPLGPTYAHRNTDPVLSDYHVVAKPGEAAGDCPVCMDEGGANHALIGCGHLLCAPCARRLCPRLCPLCRAPYVAALPRTALT